MWLIPTASAQLIPASGVPGCDFVSGNIDKDCIIMFIIHITKFFFAGIGGFCVVYIIIGGYKILISVASGGDKSSGVETIRWAIIGFIVSALTFFIIDFVLSTLAGV